jgi:hypothetical protein
VGSEEETFEIDGALDLSKFHVHYFGHTVAILGCALCRSPLRLKCEEPDCDFEAIVKSTPIHLKHKGFS